MPSASRTTTGDGHSSTVTPAPRIDAAEQRAALRDAPLAVAWLSIDGTILQANEACADLLGIDPDQVAGRELADVTDDPQGVQRLLREIAKGHDCITSELAQGRPEIGRPRITCKVVPWLSRGRRVGSRWYLIPSSTPKERPSAMSEEDVRSLVHQFRNPLASLTSGLDLLDIEGTDPETVSVLRREVEQLTRSVNHLVGFEAQRARQSPDDSSTADTAHISGVVTTRAPHLQPRILIVDDNSAICRSLALLFHGLDVPAVETALSGREALARFEEFNPEVILLDIGLPDFDGYEVARAIRASRTGDRVVLAALSGYGLEEDRRKSAAAGFDVHLVKPCGVEAILRLLDHPRLRATATTNPADHTPAAEQPHNRDAEPSLPPGMAIPTIDGPAELLQRTGQLLREVVHDARTAAFPLQIQLHLLEKREQAPPDREELAALLKEYLAMCETLHGVLRRAGTYLRDDFDYEPHAVDLSDVVRRAADSLRERCIPRSVELSWSAPAGTCFVTGDRDSLVQAVQELLDNALEASPDGGRITIRVEQHGGHASVSINDTGPGLGPPDQIDSLLRPFDRQGRKLQPLEGHVGLGLAIAHRIARQHNGRLLLRCAETGGAEALLELPLTTIS